MNARILMAAAILVTACSTETLDYTVGASPAAITVTAGKSVHLGVFSKGEVAWSVQEANGGTIANDGTYTAPATPGTYHVVATSTKDTLKSATVTVTVVPAAEKPAITAPRLVTAGKTVTASVPAQGGNTFKWSIFGGVISGADNGTSVTFSSADPGEVVLTCNATNAAGDSSGEGLAVVSILEPAAIPVISAPASVTTGRTGLTASVPVKPGITYKWTIGNGTAAGSDAGNTYGFTAGSVGTLMLSATATNAAGDASAPGTANVEVRPVGLELMAGGLGGSGNIDGVGEKARFNGPHGVGVDGTGNAYVADSNNHTIRKIAPDGTVTTLAGQPGSYTYADDVGDGARFNYPYGLVTTPSGTSYVADQNNQRIRAVAPDGTVSTISGNGGYGNVDGDKNVANYQNPGLLALAPDGGELWEFDYGYPYNLRKLVPNPDGGSSWLVSTVLSDLSADEFASGMAVHPNGAVFLARPNRYDIVETDIESYHLVAGFSGSSGYADGPGASAYFSSLGAMAFDPATSSFYVGDEDSNYLIRRLDDDAGTDEWHVTTAAGAPQDAGVDDGPALDGGRVHFVSGMAATGDGSMLFTDSYENVIRKLAAGVLSTIAGRTVNPVRVEGPGPSARFEEARGVAVGPDGTTYVSDDHYIRAISPAGVVSTFAGAGRCCDEQNTTQDGLAGSATFSQPGGMAVDPVNRILYVADETADGGFRHPTLIRAVTYEPEFGADVVTTIAGNRDTNSCTNDDHGESTLNAGFCGIQSMAVDSHGRLFFNEWSSSPARIRMLERTADGGGFAYTTVATGRYCEDAPTPRDPATPAEADFCSIGGMAVDSKDRIFFSDTDSNTLRMLELDGGSWTVTAVAGDNDGQCGFEEGNEQVDGFCRPEGLAFDRHGTLWVADGQNRAIRKLTYVPQSQSWKLETATGKPASEGVRVGPLGTGSLSSPGSLAVTPWGDVALIDENSVLLMRPPEP